MGKGTSVFVTKRTICLLSCFFWLFSLSSNSPQRVNLAGFVHLAGQSFSSLQVNGSGLLDTVHISGPLNLNGSFILKEVQCAQFKGNGAIESENFSVTEHAYINGPCIFKEATFNEVVINGFCEGHVIKVAKIMEVHGSSELCYLTCPVLRMVSKSSVLMNSVIDAITIKGGRETYNGIFNLWGLFSWTRNDAKQESVLILDATTVRGSIVFEDVSGKVILKNGSCVAGSIIGGTIEQQ